MQQSASIKKFEINIEDFSGPLEKVLELIEKEELEISKVSLAKITDDFLAYLDKLKKASIQREELNEIIIDFVIVALRLLLIKSKSLLPAKEEENEEEEELNLERQLYIYKQFKDVSLKLRELVSSGNFKFKREVLADREIIAFLPGNLSKELLKHSLERFLASYKEFKESFQKIEVKRKEADLEKYINLTFKIIKQVKETKFNCLVEKKGREEIIFVFVSLLHLANKGFIDLYQKAPFADIEIKLV